jgi:hypothetical protein
MYEQYGTHSKRLALNSSQKTVEDPESGSAIGSVTQNNPSAKPTIIRRSILKFFPEFKDDKLSN